MGDLLLGLLLTKLLSGLLLLVFGALMLGRKLGDIRHQRAKGVNGIMKIQARVNARTQGNRLALGLVFVIVCGLLLIPMPGAYRILASRLADCLLALLFLASIVLDWRAEDRQLDLVNNEEVH